MIQVVQAFRTLTFGDRAMSSDQYSEKPLPPDKKVCAACGAVAPSRGAVACWMCGESFTISEPAKSASPNPRNEWPTTSSRDSVTWDIAWLVMGLIGVGLLVVIGYEAPGFLICAVPLAAGVAFQVLIRGNRDPTVPASGHEGCLLFLATIGVVAFFGFASVIVAIQIACSRPMGH
jgi:hypothetical protein